MQHWAEMGHMNSLINGNRYLTKPFTERINQRQSLPI